MSFKTYGEIKTTVEQDLDLEDEDFIQPTELLGYCRSAIKEAEAIILKLCEDYFLDSDGITLVAGTAEYDLPSKFYADKIRAVVYASGSRIYPVKRFRSSAMFIQIADAANLAGAAPEYRYLIKNKSSGGRKIIFFPTPQEAGALITVWGIRNAALPAVDADVVDIPEHYGFIEARMKEFCLAKEAGGTAPPGAIKETNDARELMITSLSDRVPDGDNVLEQDLSHYEEHN